ncbi:hypothetical protein VD0004_g9857 [Verticillium dahliae]|nr:hypothetical protein VD0004_g9857 [Verticillium dahliae]PNH61030.1 hypothetical protein VD0001_g9773 [Verticillium dahliae]
MLLACFAQFTKLSAQKPPNTPGSKIPSES